MNFVPSQYIEDQSGVRISDTGDDFGWPVYAIAVAEGCLDGENNPCASALRVSEPGWCGRLHHPRLHGRDSEGRNSSLD